MKRRSRAGGKPAKTPRRTIVSQKQRRSPKRLRSRNPSGAGQETEVARLRRELNEAVEQQTATTDVLRVISSSPGQLEPVFRAMLENAVRILEAKFGTLFLCEGNLVRPVAGVGLPPKLREFHARRGAFVPPPGLPLARLIETKKVVHILDDPEQLSPATSGTIAAAPTRRSRRQHRRRSPETRCAGSQIWQKHPAAVPKGDVHRPHSTPSAISC